MKIGGFELTTNNYSSKISSPDTTAYKTINNSQPIGISKYQDSASPALGFGFLVGTTKYITGQSADYPNNLTENGRHKCFLFVVKGTSTKLKSSYTSSELIGINGYVNLGYYTNHVQKGSRLYENKSYFPLLAMAKGAFTPSQFNYFELLNLNTNYVIWCICQQSESSSANSWWSVGYFVHSAGDAGISELKRIQTLNSDEIVEPTTTQDWNVKSLIAFSSDSETKTTAGFYLNAGYYNSLTTGHPPYTEDGKYIGVKENGNGGISYTNIVSSLSSLDSSTYSIYELVNESTDARNCRHYSLYSGDDIGGTSSSGGSNTSTASPTTTIADYEVLQVTYSSQSSNYITDFGDWTINFIPAANQEPSIDDDNNVINFIDSSGFSGVSNTLNITPKMALNSLEIDTEELFELLDGAGATTAGSLSYYVKITNNDNVLTLSEYFGDNHDDYVTNTTFTYYQYIENGTDIEVELDFNSFIEAIYYELISSDETGYTLDVTASLQQEKGVLNLYSLELFEAYTRGHDFIQENYTTVRAEERNPEDDSETSRVMSFDENYFTYKYTGRDIDIFMGNKTNAKYLEMDYDDDVNNRIYYAAAHSSDILLESDITLGETYGEYYYFIEAARAPEWETNENGNKIVIADDEYYIKQQTGRFFYKDTFKISDYLDAEEGLYDPTEYTEEDLKTITAKIDLSQCEYYKPLLAKADNGWCDCMARTTEDDNNEEQPAVECIYQKLGYCPYRFETEKHPRRIRTLEQSKSNRFNLIQELCKVFEFYPYFYIEHENNGKVKLDDDGNMKKHVFFMTEKGSENYAGFRYEKNLNSVTRTLDSSSITTKLYVESVDSEYSDTGLCSIQTAIDNIGLTSYILDFSYYTKMGMLDAEQVQRDIYGIDTGDFAFLPRIGEYNGIYDDYSNLIITMTGEVLVELEANITVCTEGITTALEEKQSVAQTMYQFKTTYTSTTTNATTGTTTTLSYTTSDSYKNYVAKYREQSVILWGNVESLFYSGNYFSFPIKVEGTNISKELYTFYSIDYKSDDYDDLPENVRDKISDLSNYYNSYREKYCKGEFFWRLLMEGFDDDSGYEPPFSYWQDFKEKIVDEKLYEINGKLGEYKSLYNEVKYWKRERAKILNKINDLSEQFYQKYEPYIKEGTFTDSNYTTDNEYYWAGVSVLDDSCEPQVSYTFKVIDLAPLEIFRDDYTFEIADTTYIEDIDFFGVNSHTGFPNREKVIISSIEYNLDEPKSNSITLQNYTSQFDDLFEAVTASVQSLTYNENVYKRASNFTAKQYVSTESLQSTLDIGDLTLLDTANDNIVLDESGTEGNDIENTASQYKITGEGIYFSTDGGETWDYGVGAEGINMDYAKFGSLDTSKIQVVDGDYIYFLWDKDGINAYRDPSTSTDGLVDFARFNRYGLSLIENNNIRLRAGYEYLSNALGDNLTGNYAEELPLTTQNIGFYLYNDSGQPIFKTETRSVYSEDTDSDYTARLSLTGEIFATNKILSTSNSLKSSSDNNSITTVYQLSNQYFFTITQTISSSSSTNADMYENIIENGVPCDINSAANVILNEEENDGTYLYYAENLKFYNMEPISSVTISSETYTYYLVTIYSNVNIYITSEEQIENLSITYQEIIDNVYESDAEGFESFSGIDNTTLSLSYSTSISQNYYNSDGELITLKDIYQLTGNVENNTMNTTQNLSATGLIYLDETGNEAYDTFYLYASGTNTYYFKERTMLDSYISSSTSSGSLSETAVLINNKKISDESEDLTYLIDLDTIGDDDESTVKILTSIQSGADRLFSIVNGITKNDDFKCQNILSVLKNGNLYMGGEVGDYYGKDLDISGLEYLPDSIKIKNPLIVLSMTGRMYMNWDQLYNLIIDDDGNVSYGNVSLMAVLENLQNWASNASTGGSSNTSSTIGGYYITMSDE